MTLSKTTANGKPGDTSYGAIVQASCMPEDFREKASAVQAKYYPMEVAMDLSFEEKSDLMVEWWNAIHGLMIQAGFQKRWIPGVVSECNIVLRDGANEFFDILHHWSIPLYIISAGLGDIIEEAINKESTLHSNSRIVANYMDFDEEGQLQGFKGKMIHSFNKKNIVNYSKESFERTDHCSNLILLGDSLGDPTMADGMKKVDTILKIGFLNEEGDERLDAYKNIYDIVITTDETMDIINVFFKELLKNM